MPGARVRAVAGDWFAALPAHLRGTVDLVVSNPPYVAEGAELPAEVAAWEPVDALWSGPDGTVRPACGSWQRLPTGSCPTASWCASCRLSRPTTMLDAANEHFETAEVRPDLTGRPRALVARRPRR